MPDEVVSINLAADYWKCSCGIYIPNGHECPFETLHEEAK